MLLVTEYDWSDGDRPHHVGDGAEGRVVSEVVLPRVGLLVAEAIDVLSSRFEDVACRAHRGKEEAAAALEGDGELRRVDLGAAAAVWGDVEPRASSLLRASDEADPVAVARRWVGVMLVEVVGGLPGGGPGSEVDDG